MTEQVALIRVGIDSGSGGIQSPVFADGTFEYLPIPDGRGVDERTFGSLTGRHGRRFTDYFPPRARLRMTGQSVHLDPEFDGFTYGDPGVNKRGLLKLAAGDLLVFYAGLQRWEPSHGFVARSEFLGIIGYLEVAEAVIAADLTDAELHARFGTNAHVRDETVLAEQRDRLMLVRGGSGSRLLDRAVPISEVGKDKNGTPLKVLSRPMREIFSDFGGRVAIQRSMPRFVPPSHVDTAADFVRSLDRGEVSPETSQGAIARDADHSAVES